MIENSKAVRLHLVYYALAAINIIGICASLYLNFAITAKYQEVVLYNEKWSVLRSKTQEIEELASDVNEPGNSIFESNDVVKEKQKYQKSLTVFEDKMHGFKQDLVVAQPSAIMEEKIRETLQFVDLQMSDMKRASEKIFESFAVGKTKDAAKYMAKLDSSYASLREKIDELGLEFAKEQEAFLKSEEDVIEKLGHIHAVLVIFVIILVIAILLYGRTISRLVVAARETSYALDQSAIVAFADTKGRITRVNRNFADISGYTELELLGQDHRILNSGYHEKEFFKNLWKTIAQGKVWKGEVRNRRKDGSIYWVDSTIVPLKDANGHVFQYISIRYDISRRKEAEAVIEQNRQELILAKDRAEAGARTKSNFLANMSHEIRTPLNGVIGNTTLLMDTNLTEAQKEMVETIRSSSDALLALIEDILDFSKIEAGKLQIEDCPFDIRRAISDSLKILISRAQEKAIGLEMNIDQSVPMVVISDYTRFRQIVLNLISNAVKFTEKGKVVVDVQMGTREKDLLKVSVRDSGIGMTPEQQGKLFQDFSQVDASTTRKYGGTGLGLAICKNLCELLGGKIWVESTPGVGSTFHFTVKAPAANGLEPVNVPKYNLQQLVRPLGQDYPLRILVAEDNKVNQVLATKFFKKLDYDITLAENGKEALKGAMSTSFDLIFMDVHMPVLDGYEATRAIRAKVSSSAQPYIIALTASVMQSDRQLCFDAGMNDFLKKPLEMPELIAAIQKYLVTKLKKSA